VSRTGRRRNRIVGEDGSADRRRQENWYRHVRRETGVLMDGDEPVGGERNYDDLNQETPPDGWEPPEPPRFDPDELTRETHAWVRERFDTWGTDSLDEFAWPVTREGADGARRVRPRPAPVVRAVRGRDGDGRAVPLAFAAVARDQPRTARPPREPVRAVEAAYTERGVEPGAYDPDEGPAASDSGTTLDAFGKEDPGDGADDRGPAPVPQRGRGIRQQVIGWREFTRHVYREAMPELAAANQLDQSRELPPAYRDGDTDMRCLSETVGHVRKYGYAHHIERLMVLSNMALLYGTDPAELNEWFHLGFVDAYHWVTTPNVVAMGSFGTDVLSSKPYAASGSYVNRMSDYCATCPYAVSRTTGEGACPLNALY